MAFDSVWWQYFLHRYEQNHMTTVNLTLNKLYYAILNYQNKASLTPI